MTTAVVCDDDTTLRSAISALCTDAGLTVVAETDSGADAAEMVRRFAVDVLVLDLSLSDGSGEHVLTMLHEQGAPTAVIVFTAYGDDPAKLVYLGAREVVEKPDFERLGAVLSRLGSATEPADAPQDDRRFGSRPVEAATTMWQSPSGVSSHHDLAHSLLTLEAGDAVLAVTIIGLDALETDVGPLLTADCRLAVGRALRQALRVQDLVHEAPQIGGFVALLRGGDARAAGSAWARLSSVVARDAVPGILKGSASRVADHGAGDAVERALGALRLASIDGPPFTSV